MKRFLIQVSAGGKGPPEARAFVALLAARVQCLCLEQGLEVAALAAPLALPHSVEFVVCGEAVAALIAELGTHALVARSAARGQRSRKRWFAQVALHDAPAAQDELARHPTRTLGKDLRVTAMRAGGPGGQHVNKVSTAVRVEHRPSGITVRAANRRSRAANLREAEARIAEQLAARAATQEASAGAARRLAHHRLQRGLPVRCYRLDHAGRLVALPTGAASGNR